MGRVNRGAGTYYGGGDEEQIREEKPSWWGDGVLLWGLSRIM